jgi:hypothetical protein
MEDRQPSEEGAPHPQTWTRKMPGRTAGSVVHVRERARITEPLSLSEEAAEQASGYFFLSFGKANSGKSTLHYHILRYIEQEGDFEGEEVVGDHISPGQAAAQASLMSNWRNLWIEGEFPLPTDAADEVRAIRYALRPKIGNGPRVEVTFLEVAGELISGVMPDDARTPVEIPAALDRLMLNEAVKLIIAFIVSPRALAQEQDEKRPDALYVAFLNLIRKCYPKRSNTPLMVILSDPQEAYELTRKHVQDTGERSFSDKMVESYLGAYMRSFIQHYVSWKALPEQKVIARFRVGKIVESKTSDGGVRRLIGQPAYFDDAARITKFMYETFTGVRIRHGIFRRILIALGVAS